MTSSTQLPGLSQYMARHRFAPNPGHPAWLDRGTGQQTIRVLNKPGETTWLYCLDQQHGCLYEARFSPGTPDTVITAAIEAVLSPPSPGRSRATQATGQRRTREGKR